MSDPSNATILNEPTEQRGRSSAPADGRGTTPESPARSPSPRQKSNYDTEQDLLDIAPVLREQGLTEQVMSPGPLAGQKPVFRIALTGGPCGGKTTCASVLSDRLQDLGWRVFRVPEAATILLGGGVNFYGLNEEQQYTFQKALLQLMLSIENSFLQVARSCGQRAVVIFDRGAMDCSAYMPPDQWNRLLNELDQSTIEMRDGRYDCVVHLVTAAEGAAQFYSNATNATRTEGVEFAITLDHKVKDAWNGHPYLRVIDNSTDFSHKVNRVVEAVFEHIGEHVPGLVKRKFLVCRAPSKEEISVKYQDYDVDHDYLLSQDGSQHRLRKRGQFGINTFTHTIRYPAAHGQRLELRRVLTGRDYVSMLSQRDPDRVTIHKNRRTFVYANRYYQLDYYLDPVKDLILLETYMQADDPLDLPPFLEIAKEVTGEKDYSMYTLALKPEGKARYQAEQLEKDMWRGLDMK